MVTFRGSAEKAESRSSLRSTETRARADPHSRRRLESPPIPGARCALQAETHAGFQCEVCGNLSPCEGRVVVLPGLRSEACTSSTGFPPKRRVSKETGPVAMDTPWAEKPHCTSPLPNAATKPVVWGTRQFYPLTFPNLTSPNSFRVQEVNRHRQGPCKHLSLSQLAWREATLGIRKLLQISRLNCGNCTEMIGAARMGSASGAWPWEPGWA